MSNTVSENMKFNVSTLPTHQEPERNDVDKYMTKQVPCLKPEMDLILAAKLLLREDTNGLPVIDSNGELVGFLSEKDCLKHAYESKYNALPPQQVKDFMSTKLQTLNSGSDIYTAIDLFINQNFQCYPVVKRGKYLGILYRSNALKAVVEFDDRQF